MEVASNPETNQALSTHVNKKSSHTLPPSIFSYYWLWGRSTTSPPASASASAPVSVSVSGLLSDIPDCPNPTEIPIQLSLSSNPSLSTEAPPIHNISHIIDNVGISGDGDIKGEEVVRDIGNVSRNHRLGEEGSECGLDRDLDLSLEMGT